MAALIDLTRILGFHYLTLKYFFRFLTSLNSIVDSYYPINRFLSSFDPIKIFYDLLDLTNVMKVSWSYLGLNFSVPPLVDWSCVFSCYLLFTYASLNVD